MSVKKGDKIKVEYTGTLDSGQVFDTTDNREPLAFEVGSGQLIKGFDDAVVGMEKGDQKDVKVEAKDAYGKASPDLVKKVPKSQLPEGEQPKEGMALMLHTKDGQQVPARITAVGDEDITIDLNHPLAGKNLNFKIKVVDIEG
jgi:FKBP-type peptidyl-prolyl cis-trans isomerase 2